MRVLIALLAFMLMASVANAAPFLVCDPQQGVEYFTITGLPAPLDGSNVQAQTDGSLKIDLAQCPVGGPYQITVAACAGVWGCSPVSPFAFTRPGTLKSVTGIRLSK